MISMQQVMKRDVKPRSFSLSLFLVVVILLSWPFQIAYPFLGEEYKPLLLVSMIMVAVGTYICGKWIFKDGFTNAGWSWGKPKYYLYVFLLALFLWLFPSVIERSLGWYVTDEVGFSTLFSSFFISFIITIIPAFSEEFTWRGYLLPRLMRKYHERKALLIHGLITWVWHLPFVVVIGWEVGGNPWVSVPLVLAVSFIPTIMHAVVFAFIWMRTGSLAVSTIYHVSFDEVRDTLGEEVGLGSFGQNWQMLVLTLLGVLLLVKAPWKKLLPRQVQIIPSTR